MTDPPREPHETFVVERETPIQIGVPADPIPAERIDALGRKLSAIPEIEAAYVPMIDGLPGQLAPAQVLVLQIVRHADRDRIARALGPILEECRLTPIDVLQFHAGHYTLRTAARTRCVVPFPGREPRPWWKFW